MDAAAVKRLLANQEAMIGMLMQQHLEIARHMDLLAENAGCLDSNIGWSGTLEHTSDDVHHTLTENETVLSIDSVTGPQLRSSSRGTAAQNPCPPIFPDERYPPLTLFPCPETTLFSDESPSMEFPSEKEFPATLLQAKTRQDCKRNRSMMSTTSAIADDDTGHTLSQDIACECGTEFYLDESFCRHCGTRRYQDSDRCVCGCVLRNVDQFCGSCGLKQDEETEATVVETTSDTQATLKKGSLRRSSIFAGALEDLNMNNRVKALGGRINRNLTRWNMDGDTTHYYSVHAQRPACILHPHTVHVIAWHFLIAASVVYVCLMVPFELCFSWWVPSEGAQMLFSILEVVFWLDVIVSFRTAYEHRGHLVQSQKDIALHYLRFWFWIDMLANIPWEKVLGDQVINSKAERKAVAILKWLKLPRLLRLATVRKLVNTISGGAMGKYMSLCLSGFAGVFLIHFVACAWVFSLAPCQDDPVDHDQDTAWLCDQGRVFPVYVQALHLACSVIFGNHVASSGSVDNGYLALLGRSPGLEAEVQDLLMQFKHGQLNSSQAHKLSYLAPGMQAFSNVGLSSDVNATTPLSTFMKQGGGTRILTWGIEHWNSMFFTMLIAQVAGIILIGLTLALFVKLVLTSNWQETYFRMQTEMVNNELEQCGDIVPEPLRIKVLQYFRWKFHNGNFGPLQMLDPALMTPNLSRAMARTVYHGLLENVITFSQVGEHALVEISSSLRTLVYLPEEHIHKIGEPLTGLYIIDKGSVTICGRQLPVLGIKVERGDAFGEYNRIAKRDISIPWHIRLPAHLQLATASTVTKVAMLDVESLQRISSQFKDFLAAIAKKPKLSQHHEGNRQLSHHQVVP